MFICFYSFAHAHFEEGMFASRHLCCLSHGDVTDVGNSSTLRQLRRVLHQAGAKYVINFSFDIPGAGIYVQTADDLTRLQSAYAEAIDYYYVYGPSVDRIIQGYREFHGGMRYWVVYPWIFHMLSMFQAFFYCGLCDCEFVCVFWGPFLVHLPFTARITGPAPLYGKWLGSCDMSKLQKWSQLQWGLHMAFGKAGSTMEARPFSICFNLTLKSLI